MSDDSDLQKLRVEIDALDEQIQALITERAHCAAQVAVAKKEAGSNLFYRPEREADILRRVAERNEGPLSDAEMVRLFREIISACLALEAKQTIAYLGPEGTFTQQAVFKHFGHSVDTLPFDAIDEIFREVEAGTAKFGVVPVENSTVGQVNNILDMFMRSSLKICGEVQLRIHHHLLAAHGDREKIAHIASHPTSLAQCREWLDANLPKAERIAVSSNAEAARRAAGDDTLAAIAGESAADIYGLTKLATSIEDEPNNTTRFLVIGALETGPSGKDKTSIMVSNKNRPGSLYELLGVLSRHGININRIESRPSRQTAWEYVFFLDMEGHAAQSPLREALHELEQHTALFRVLGSYPVAVQ